MSLRTTIPTLEIKTSGTDLSLVDTLYVTIKRTDFQTVKSNDNIEVDNDLISVSLSQEEAAQLADGGGANVSIVAVGPDSAVTTVRVAWVRRGSRTDSAGGGGGSGGGESVSSFNGRTGDVIPAIGDYTAEMVGAATMEQINEAIQSAILDSWGASY